MIHMSIDITIVYNDHCWAILKKIVCCHPIHNCPGGFKVGKYLIFLLICLKKH